MKQMGFYTKSMPRKNRKRAYLFDYDHVKNIFNRYTPQINGFNGSMVYPQQNQSIPGDHCQKVQWSPMVSQWSSDHSENKSAIEMPLKAIEKPLKTIDLKFNGQAESLENKGKAGDVPLKPLEMTEIEKEILEKVSNETIDLDLLGAEL